MRLTSRMVGERGRRQAAKLGLAPGRVPPGQYLTERFPVLTYGYHNDADPWQEQRHWF